MIQHYRPSVVVMGAGALGSVIGGLLAEGGLQVTLAAPRREHPHTITARGALTIVGHGGERLIPVRATADARSVKTADVVIFLCKALATKQAALDVAHLLANPHTVAVSFQNGLGNEEESTAVVGHERVIAALTALGARLEAPGVVRNFASLQGYIGEIEGGQSIGRRSLQGPLKKATRSTSRTTSDLTSGPCRPARSARWAERRRLEDREARSDRKEQAAEVKAPAKAGSGWNDTAGRMQ